MITRARSCRHCVCDPKYFINSENTNFSIEPTSSDSQHSFPRPTTPSSKIPTATYEIVIPSDEGTCFQNTSHDIFTSFTRRRHKGRYKFHCCVLHSCPLLHSPRRIVPSLFTETDFYLCSDLNRNSSTLQQHHHRLLQPPSPTTLLLAGLARAPPTTRYASKIHVVYDLTSWLPPTWLLCKSYRCVAHLDIS